MDNKHNKTFNTQEYHYTNFINALKSKSTKLDYTRRLKFFMDFLHIKQYHQLVEDKKTIENDIKSFLVYLRKDRKVSYKSASHYLDAVKKFFVNSEYEFKWGLIKMYLGDDDNEDEEQQQQQQKEREEDRPYVRSEYK